MIPTESVYIFCRGRTSLDEIGGAQKKAASSSIRPPNDERSTVRPRRKIYTDSVGTKESKVGKVFFYIHDLVQTFESWHKVDPRLSYRNDSNDIKIIAGDRQGAQKIFLGSGVRTVTPPPPPPSCWTARSPPPEQHRVRDGLRRVGGRHGTDGLPPQSTALSRECGDGGEESDK